MDVYRRFSYNHTSTDDLSTFYSLPSTIYATNNTDDPEHMQWIFQKSFARAQQFGIPGVTLQHTQGVVKNIIPAIASTNAIIAAACALETLKIVSMCSKYVGRVAATCTVPFCLRLREERKKLPNCVQINICSNSYFFLVSMARQGSEQLYDVLFGHINTC